MAKNVYFIGVSLKNGAVPDHFIALAKELTKRGNKVVLLPWGLGSDGAINNIDTNILILPWPSPRPIHLTDAIFLYRIIKQYRPICVIGNFGSVNLLMLIGWLSGVPCRVAWYRTLSRQIFFDWQSTQWLLTLLNLRKRLIYSLATHLVGNSEAAVLDAITTYGLPKQKCKVFYNSLLDPWNKISIIADKKKGLVICAGRLNISKGQDILLEAVAKLYKQVDGIKVSFLGSGPKLSEWVDRAKELGLGDICEFVGAVSHDDVIATMSQASVTIVPSREEAFGFVALESMSVGTAVIASRVGGLAEIVRDGIDGFLVPPEDPDAIASKLKILLDDPNLCIEMGKNARTRFLEVYEQSRAVHAQADWLEQIVLDSSHA